MKARKRKNASRRRERREARDLARLKRGDHRRWVLAATWFFVERDQVRAHQGIVGAMVAGLNARPVRRYTPGRRDRYPWLR